MEEPPSYAATAIPPRSIQDLRAQIVANGYLIEPHYQIGIGLMDHIEVVVAKTPASTSAQEAHKTPHFAEKQAMRPDGTYQFQPSREAQASATASSSALGTGGKHYAVLVRRHGSTSTRLRIILKGEAKDTVEEALAWMLEKTEMLMHDMVVRVGKSENDGEYVVM